MKKICPVAFILEFRSPLDQLTRFWLKVVWIPCSTRMTASQVWQHSLTQNSIFTIMWTTYFLNQVVEFNSESNLLFSLSTEPSDVIIAH